MKETYKIGKVSTTDPIDISDKLDVFRYATGKEGLNQLDAKLLLDNYENYEGKIIHFYANETAPEKIVSWGFVLKQLDNVPVLIEIDRNGHTIKWTKESNYNANDSIGYREV